MNISRLIFSFFSLGLCAGCGTFSHQTSPTTAHAFLLIQDVSEDSRAIKSVDGKRITHFHQGKIYRISEGMHSVIIQERLTETIQYTDKPEDMLARAMINLSGTPPPTSYQELSNKEFAQQFYATPENSYILTPYILKRTATNGRQQ